MIKQFIKLCKWFNDYQYSYELYLAQLLIAFLYIGLFTQAVGTQDWMGSCVIGLVFLANFILFIGRVNS